MSHRTLINLINMKYFLVFLFVVFQAHAQTGKIVYSSILNFGGSANITENHLYFTNHSSFYHSPATDRKTERNNQTKTNSENSKVVAFNITSGSDSVGNVYYHNLSEDNLVCRESIYENGKVNYFIYDDNAPIDWRLEDEFKNISGFKCQKATAKFRGRNYEAWFTIEIPLSFGPWKFHGLPGLILEVYDQTGQVYFTAESIKIPYVEAANYVKKPTGDSIITNKDFQEKKYQSFEKNSQAMLARSPVGSKIVSSEVKINGIEIEYEWEKE